jgi:hypothetical protein
MDVKAVGLWRHRWVALHAIPLEKLPVRERLADAPRPGAVPRLSPEQVCQILALACEQQSGSDRPISQWSHRELADEIVRRGIRPHLAAPCLAVVEKRPTCRLAAYDAACATHALDGEVIRKKDADERHFVDSSRRSEPVG